MFRNNTGWLTRHGGAGQSFTFVGLSCFSEGPREKEHCLWYRKAQIIQEEGDMGCSSRDWFVISALINFIGSDYHVVDLLLVCWLIV